MEKKNGTRRSLSARFGSQTQYIFAFPRRLLLTMGCEKGGGSHEGPTWSVGGRQGIWRRATENLKSEEGGPKT